MKRPRTDVLIVEDDPWLSEQFERQLLAAGLTSAVTISGATAIELIDQLHPRALLLDMLIAGGTGLALLHELQSYRDTARLPVVLCTNLAADIGMDNVASYGVKRIVDKATMLPDEIVTAVRSVLV